MGKKKSRTRRRGPRGQGTRPFWDATRRRYRARKWVNGELVERSGRTEEEVLAKLAEASPPGPKTTVGQYAERWLANLDVAPKTRDSYEVSARKYWGPVIGHLVLDRVTPGHVESLARTLKMKAGLAPNTVLLALVHLSALMTAAVREGLRGDNPVSAAKKPRSVRTEIDPFTPEELVRVVEAANRHERTRILSLLATTGMRHGEALALEVKDFDPVKRTLRIERTYLNRKHGIGPAKSERSRRTIDLSPEAVEVVRRAVGRRKHGLLFPSKEVAGPKSHGIVRSAWLSLLARLRIRARKIHELRHTFISQLVAAGHPIADVARHCGNSPAVILSVYLHPVRTDMAAAVSAMLKGQKRR